jgi:hypothetical protein
MYKRVIDFLNSSNILTEEQFGFRKVCQLIRAFYKFIDELLAPNP